jgi:hypothetical protein
MRRRLETNPTRDWNKRSLNLLDIVLWYCGGPAMSRYLRPPQYDWSDDWPDDCPPPYHGRVTFTHPPPAHARVAVQLPPCQPHAGTNTDRSGNSCAALHNSSSYALLPAPPARPQASQPVPSASPQTSQPTSPAQPHASQPTPSQPAPPAPPQGSQPSPPKPAADPVTVGQVAPDHVHQQTVLSSLGWDVAIGLGLALAFVVVRRFVLDLIEPSPRARAKWEGRYLQ